MPRIRMLKPSFFTNDVLATVHPLGRLLFAGLWCIADREGRLEDRPARIKAEVLPYDKANVDRLLDDLHSLGFIERYTIGEARFIQVANFSKHQSPHVKEAASTIPARCSPVPKTSAAPPDPDPITDPDPSPETGRVPLTVEQERLRVKLHHDASEQVLKGVTAPDEHWCEDLIRRDTRESDIDYAIQAALPKQIGDRPKGLSYIRTVLESRVVGRENGIDHDQLARDRAESARREPHGRSIGARGVARNGEGPGALSEFGDLPPDAIRPTDHAPAIEESPAAGAPLSFPGRAQAGGGAR